MSTARVYTRVQDLLRDEMDRQDWRDREHVKWSVIGWIALAVAVGFLVVSAMLLEASGDRLPILGLVASIVLAISVLAVISKDSPLSPAGQEAARPWNAYKEGISAAATDDTIALDLNQALPDAMAMNIAPKLNDRVERAFKAGLGLTAFAATMGLATDRGRSYFPYWTAYSSTMGPASSGSSSTVSGGGSGGGGGAAGST